MPGTIELVSVVALLVAVAVIGLIGYHLMSKRKAKTAGAPATTDADDGART
jgi:Tfp pilus assembly protein PilV